MARRFLFVLALLTVLASGCGGSDSASTTTAGPPLSLQEYLAQILELELVSSAPTPSGVTTPNELAAYNYDIASRYQAALDTIVAITPPAEAAEHAEAYRAYAELGAQTFQAAAESVLEGSAEEGLQDKLAEINTTSEQLGTLFNGLLTTALESNGDALSLYLVTSISMRDEFSDAYTNAVDGLGPLIASGDGQTIAEALESSAAEFAGYLEDWDELDPPPQATETHSRQTALIAEVAGIFSDLVEPVRAEDDQATSAVASRMETFISNVGEASQAWNRLMVEGLRG